MPEQTGNFDGFFEGAAAVISKIDDDRIDSTLRGNISAELQALAHFYPDWRIAYAPAYPALGRTVRLGVLYVDGIAVAETAFANDALNPVRSSSVSAVLHPELSCTIFDGETDEHLAAAARTIAPTFPGSCSPASTSTSGSSVTLDMTTRTSAGRARAIATTPEG